MPPRKTALVTESTSGIGLTMATELASRGMNLVLNGFEDTADIKMSKTQVNLNLIPHVNGTPAIAQLVGYELTDTRVHGAWSGPARLHLVPHVDGPVADLPVRGIVGGLHFIADLTLPYDRVSHDYLVT